jgi:hypothetical protein
MGSTAELITEVDEDVTCPHWHVAGQTFGLIFAQACVLVAEKPWLGIPPSPPPDPTKTPSPNLLVAKDCVKRVLDYADDNDSEDMRSTVERASSPADSRTTLELDVADSECDVEAIRALARDALGRGAETGSLMEMLQTAIVPGGGDKILPETTSEARDQALPMQGSNDVVHRIEEVRSAAKDAIVKGLLDGRLDDALASTFEPRSAAEDAIMKGLLDGRLDDALASAFEPSRALVPRPPESARTEKNSQRPVVRPQAGEAVEEALQMISVADRKVGNLHVQISEKQRQIRESDERYKMMTDSLKETQTSLQHLGVDLQWHQEQILAAEDRWNRLTDEKRAIALKLDEMRMIKDSAPGTKAPNTARSWASTATGGGLGDTTFSFTTPGANPDRSAIMEKQYVY